MEQKKRRARSPKGQFKGNNPDNPELNDAWEPEPIKPLTPKVKYTVKPSVRGSATAGKYTMNKKIRPSFGGLNTTSN